MADIQYRFIATGQDAVLSAFGSIGAAAKRAAKDTEASYRTGETAAKRSGATQVDAAAKAARELERLRNKENDALLREGNKLIAQEERVAAKRIALEEKTSQKIAAARAKYMERAAANALSSVASYGAGLIARATGMTTSMASVAVRQSLHLDDIARRVSVNSRGAGQEFQDPTKLRKQFEQVAINTPGIKSEDVGAAAQVFVDYTGDLKGATENLQTFATVASATGASIEDVARSAGALSKQMNIKSVDEMRQAMTLLAFAGKGENLTLEDQATLFKRLAAAAAGYGLGGGVAAVGKLGGLLQIAGRGSGGARQSGTAVENLLTRLQTHSGQLKSLGVDVSDSKGHKNDINEVLAQTVTKVGGTNADAKFTQLQKIFGTQGMRDIKPLISTYTSASEAAGGGAAGQKAGYEAVKAALDKASSATTEFAELQRDAAFMQEATGARLTAVWESVKATIANDVLPALQDMGPTVKDALPPLLNALGVLASTAVAAAGALGLLSPTSHEETAKALDKKAEDAKTPEEKAKFVAQANLERAKGETAGGVETRKAELESEFKANFTKAGGNTLGARLNSGIAASDAENPNSQLHKIRQQILGSYDTVGGKHHEGMNAEQAKLLAKYQGDLAELTKHGGTKGESGADVAGKGVANIASSLGAVIRAELAASVAAQNASAAAQKEAAKAMNEHKGGTIHHG